MNVSYMKTGLMVYLILVSACMAIAQDNDSNSQESVARKTLESVIDGGAIELEQNLDNGQNLDNDFGGMFETPANVVQPEYTHSDFTQPYAEIVENEGYSIRRNWRNWSLQKIGSVISIGSKSNARLGFDVEEVQYGANAGSPSFGVVSHGPWYNGDTFGPYTIKHRCSALCKKHVSRLGRLMPGGKREQTANSFDCEQCREQTIETVTAPASYGSQFDKSSMALPVEVLQEDIPLVPGG